MARIHILAGGSQGLYTVVVHTATPLGNNFVGVPWADALKNSGMNKTTMVVGNGPGLIANNEATDIANGSVFEARDVVQIDPNMDIAQLNADLDLRATQLSTEKLALLQQQLKYFGHTRNPV